MNTLHRSLEAPAEWRQFNVDVNQGGLGLVYRWMVSL